MPFSDTSILWNYVFKEWNMSSWEKRSNVKCFWSSDAWLQVSAQFLASGSVSLFFCFSFPFFPIRWKSKIAHEKFFCDLRRPLTPIHRDHIDTRWLCWNQGSCPPFRFPVDTLTPQAKHFLITSQKSLCRWLKASRKRGCCSSEVLVLKFLFLACVS